MFSEVCAAAVLYTKNSPSRDALALFARELQKNGTRVGGLVQETYRHESGRKIRVDIIDIATNERIVLNKPTKEQINNGGCSIDVSALSESSATLRRAIDEKVELSVVEKFGEQEQIGAGLLHEIMTAMAEGIRTLVLVPADAIEQWDEVSGGSTTHLPCELDALRQWWRSAVTSLR